MIYASPQFFEFGTTPNPTTTSSNTGKIIMDTWEWMIHPKTIYKKAPMGLLPMEAFHLRYRMEGVGYLISIPHVIGEALFERAILDPECTNVSSHRIKKSGRITEGYMTDKCPDSEKSKIQNNDLPEQQRPWLPPDWPSPWPSNSPLLIKANPIYHYPQVITDKQKDVICSTGPGERELVFYDNFGQYCSSTASFIKYLKGFSINDVDTLEALKKAVEDIGDAPAIVVCPDRVTMFMEELEFENERLFDLLFSDAKEALEFGIKYVLSHEMGHHLYQVDESDAPWAECLANWFSYCLFDEKGRKAMYAWSLKLPTPYRYYLALVDLQMQPVKPTIFSMIMSIIRRGIILTSAEADNAPGFLSGARWLWLYNKDYPGCFEHRFMIRGLFGEYYRLAYERARMATGRLTILTTPGIAYLEDLLEPEIYLQLFRDIRNLVIGKGENTLKVGVADYEGMLTEEFKKGPLNRSIDI